MLISSEHKVHLYNLSSILVINLQTYYLYILACAKNEHCYQLNQHNEPYAQVQWWSSVIIHLPVFPGVQLLVYYLHYFHFRRLSSSIPHYYSGPIIFLPVFLKPISLHSAWFMSPCSSVTFPFRISFVQPTSSTSLTRVTPQPASSEGPVLNPIIPWILFCHHRSLESNHQID